MTIDLESWRGRAKIKLQQLQTYLTQAPDGLTAATYTTLCGLTLWPLAAAAVSGGGADAYMATLMLANGIGGNLLANLIQSWRDRSVKGEELSEEQFIASLGEQIQASTEEWVPKLGEILDKLDALPAAAEPLT
ncbi:MAG: hypothetical protein KDE51_04015, partial [Anaerolineales bacterium]|nr:hypothetical protein [Anaerolineales bacterium]